VADDHTSESDVLVRILVGYAEAITQLQSVSVSLRRCILALINDDRRLALEELTNLLNKAENDPARFQPALADLHALLEIRQAEKNDGR